MRKKSRGLISLLALSCLSASTRAAEPEPAAPSLPQTERQQLMEKLKADLETYYANAYGAPLKQKSRLARLVAVVSLSRIDAMPITERLIEAASGDDLLVAQVAWDALHARHASLTDDQRNRWLDAGLKARKRGAFPGETGLPLLSAVAGYVYDADPKMIADMVGDSATAENAEKLRPIVLKLFQTRPDCRWLRPLVTKYLRQADSAARVEPALRSIPGAPSGVDKPGQLVVAWDRFINGLPKTDPLEPGAYAGTSEAFPKPEKIDNPEGAKWRRELELPNLPTERIELAYCIDSTGSMVEVNKLLAATLQPLTMAMGLAASDVRAGVVYYRHETVPALQKGCCKKAASDPKNHTVFVVPLSKQVDAVVGAMRSFYIDPNAGHDGGTGAYAAALEAATKLNWGNAKTSERVVIVIGDAVPTDGSVDHATKCAALLKQNGVRLHFLELNNNAAKAVSPMATAGGNAPVIFQSDMALYKKFTGAGKPLPLSEAIKSNVGTTVTNVIRDTLPPEFHDRMDTLWKATLPILQATLDTQAAKPSRYSLLDWSLATR